MTRYAHHKYTWTKQGDWTRHDWSLVGPLGAVSFHASVATGDAAQYGPSAGLEFHHTEEGVRQSAPYLDGAPHHVNCPLTGGRCWHDGTSSYAIDTLWPRFAPLAATSSHEAIFALLEAEADRHFHPKTEEA